MTAISSPLQSGPEFASETSKRHAATWAVLSSSVLIVGKISVWFFTGSVSVLAEACHSCSDLIGSALSLISVRYADDPPDRDHAYGHGKYENVSGLMIAILVFGVGVVALHEAIQHLSTSRPITSPTLALIVMGVSAVFNAAISYNLLRVGKRTDSPALIADGKHLQTDIFTSLAVFASLAIMQITGLRWIDPAAAMVVAGFIFTIAFQIGRDSVSNLSDAALPSSEVEMLTKALTSDPRVLSFHKLRTRKAGSHRHVDVHVLISDTLSFVTAHDISEEIEDRLRSTLPNTHVIVHIEPYEAEQAKL